MARNPDFRPILFDRDASRKVLGITGQRKFFGHFRAGIDPCDAVVVGIGAPNPATVSANLNGSALEQPCTLQIRGLQGKAKKTRA
jgi:hypothetical protein